MDPNATLALALTGDREAARNYNNWVANGGFRAAVETHPATDAWMRGLRFGEVTKVGTKYAHVRFRGGRVMRFPFDLVRVIGEGAGSW